MAYLRVFAPQFAFRNPRTTPQLHVSSYESIASVNFAQPVRTRATSHSGRTKPYLECMQSEYFEPQRFSSSRRSMERFRSDEDGGGGGYAPSPSARVYVGYSIYKGKAALTVEPRAPEFSLMDSGAYKISKDGFVYLQFAPASGVRQYDWSRKQVFSLSVFEVGSIISLGPKDSCEFFHDPFKGRSDEGKVRKVLKVEPLPDGSGHFFNLSVQNRLLNVDESIYIPINKAEFTVLVSAMRFILPYLLGWNAFANSIKPEDSLRGNNANASVDFEWSSINIRQNHKRAGVLGINLSQLMCYFLTQLRIQMTSTCPQQRSKNRSQRRLRHLINKLISFF